MTDLETRMNPSVAPILSTPETHIFNNVEGPIATNAGTTTTTTTPRKILNDEQFDIRYEIGRTVREIREHQIWRRIALQFPDEMLRDSARVYQQLARGLRGRAQSGMEEGQQENASTAHRIPGAYDAGPQVESKDDERHHHDDAVKLTILADTSYGSCCVDEIAAEHVSADVVVHYGRACLSPTARTPVIHVFTRQDLDVDDCVRSFSERLSDKESKVVITADMPYAHHVKELGERLEGIGYGNVFVAEIVHDPGSLIPNRTVPGEVQGQDARIKEWELFHISQPPTALLLTLSSRIKEVHIYPTDTAGSTTASEVSKATTSAILRRRYALVTSLATVAIWGILINTLSVKNYLQVVNRVKEMIAAAGKKSYLFVVGKLNAAKVANFSEIGGWVVIGCWETSLIDSKEFYKPVITPFELELALTRDEERLWSGNWRADFEELLQGPATATATNLTSAGSETEDKVEQDEDTGDYDSEEESAPPEYDLRTGRYISHSRPMKAATTVSASKSIETSMNGNSKALTTRPKTDMVSMNGVASPAANFLKSQRTWQGLGSDFDPVRHDEVVGDAIEEGRSGVARGYTVSDQART